MKFDYKEKKRRGYFYDRCRRQWTLKEAVGLVCPGCGGEVGVQVRKSFGGDYFYCNVCHKVLFENELITTSKK